MPLPTAKAIMAKPSALKVALEDVNGLPEQEIEYTFYGKLKSIRELDKAKHKETHEQWKLPLAIKNGVKSRIRCINEMRWVLTTKTTITGKLGVEEIEVDITKEMFARLRQAGEDGYKKTRYNFPIMGTDKKWEVDVFMNQLGEPSLWVKIDLEVSGRDDAIPEFPFELDDIITNQETQQTVEENRFIKKLWENEWVRLDV